MQFAFPIYSDAGSLPKFLLVSFKSRPVHVPFERLGPVWIWLMNPFFLSVSFLYPLKTSVCLGWGGGYAAVTLKKWVKMPELKKTLTTLTRYFPEMNLKLTLIYENYQWTSLFLRKVQYLPKLSQQGDILLCHHDNSNKPLQKFLCNF